MNASGNWRRWIVGLCVVGVLIWIVFSLGIMPRMIASAYDGHGFGPLVQMMSHKQDHSLEHYQTKFFDLAVVALALWVLGLLLPVATTSRWFEEKIVGRATPGTLGAMRTFVCIIAINSVLKDNTLSAVKLIADGVVPKRMGMMEFAYQWLGFDWIISNYNALLTFKITTVVLLTLAGIGLLTRPTIILATIFYLLLQGIQRSFYWFNHTGLVPFYILFVLCFARCADGFSVDRIIRIWRQKPVADPDVATRSYGWARWFVWLAICLPYMMAGLSKLTNGTLLWWESKNLMAIIYRNALRPDFGSHGWLLDSSIPTWFFTFAGISTILTEIGMGLCLVSRRARWILPPIAVAMHYGILKVMLIPFYDLMLVQALFWDWRTIRIWFADRISKYRHQWTLLYDGHCPLCRRAVGNLSGIDLLKRIEFVSFRTLDLDNFNKNHNVSLTRQRADSEMILVGNGRTWGGYDAYQQMTLMIPLLMPVAPLMWLPGISHIGRAIYSWIARNRLSFFQCHDACELSPGVLPLRESENPSQRFVLASVLAFVIPLIMFASWLRGTEYYPVTSFQMFTLYHDAYDNSGTVTYYRLFAQYADGSRSIAYPEKLVKGTSSRYWGMIPGAFKTDPKLYEDRKKLGDWLANIGRQYNADHLDSKDRIEQFIVQEHRWDFIHNRNDRAYGKVVRYFVVPCDGDSVSNNEHFAIVDGSP